MSLSLSLGRRIGGVMEGRDEFGVGVELGLELELEVY